MSTPDQSPNAEVTISPEALALLIGQLGIVEQQLNDLGATLAGVREALGHITIGTGSEVATSPPLALETEGIPTSVTLFSSREANKVEFLDGVRARVNPYVRAFQGELLTRTAASKGSAPTPPSYSDNPEKWHRFIDKRSEKCEWTDTKRPMEMRFTLSYLPDQQGNKLAMVSVNTVEPLLDTEKDSRKNQERSVVFCLDQGEIIELSYIYRTRDVVYRDVTYGPGQRLRFTDKGLRLSEPDDFDTFLEFTYDPATGESSFVDSRSPTKTPKLIQPISAQEALDFVDVALSHIPVMPTKK